MGVKLSLQSRWNFYQSVILYPVVEVSDLRTVTVRVDELPLLPAKVAELYGTCVHSNRSSTLKFSSV